MRRRTGEWGAVTAESKASGVKRVLVYGYCVKSNPSSYVLYTTMHHTTPPRVPLSSLRIPKLLTAAVTDTELLSLILSYCH